MKIILLYGGRSAEHDVSLLSAFSVVNAVYYNYYQVQLVMITKDGQWLKGSLLTEAPTSKEVLNLTASAYQGRRSNLVRSRKRMRLFFRCSTDQMEKMERSKVF